MNSNVHDVARDPVWHAQGDAGGVPLALTAYRPASALVEAPKWLPATLRLGPEAMATRYDGRVHGLGEDRAIVFSALVQRVGGRNVYADLLRAVPTSGDGGALRAVFVPPSAAAQIKTVLASAMQAPETVRSAAKQEAQRLQGNYGVPARMSVQLDLVAGSAPPRPPQGPSMA